MLDAQLLPASILANNGRRCAAPLADCWVESYGPFGLVSPELVRPPLRFRRSAPAHNRRHASSRPVLAIADASCSASPQVDKLAQEDAQVVVWTQEWERSHGALQARFLASHGASGWPSRVARRTQPMGHLCGGLYKKADCLNLHTDGSHQHGPVVGVCGARGSAAAAARAALLPSPAQLLPLVSPRDIFQRAVWADNNGVLGSLPAKLADGGSAAEQPLGARGTPLCGKLPRPCGWMVIVPNIAEFKRRGIMAQYDAKELYVLACHPGGGYAMGGADMQSLYLHGKLPVECTEAEAMHVMYILRYYQDFPAARLEALDAAGLAPPAGSVLQVDWANPAASALRRTYLGGRVAKAVVHSAVATVNAALIRDRVPSAPVWLPGDQFRNHSVLQLLALAPHCKGASLDFLKNTGALSALFLKDESKKASDLEVDELSFASDDAAAGGGCGAGDGGSAGAGAAPVQPLLRLVHYARCVLLARHNPLRCSHAAR